MEPELCARLFTHHLMPSLGFHPADKDTDIQRGYETCPRSFRSRIYTLASLASEPVAPWLYPSSPSLLKICPSGCSSLKGHS